MSYLLPTIDTSNLPNDGTCYLFYNNFLIVYFQDSSYKKYTLLNNKIYENSDDTIITISPDTSCSEPCSNLLNIIDYTDNRNGLDKSSDSNKVSVVGTTTGGYVVNLNFTTPQTFSAGVYYVKINQPLNYILYPAGTSYNNCRILQGETSTTCSMSNTWTSYLSIAYGSNSVFNIEDLEIFISEQDSNFCSYGSSVPCESVPETSISCYSYSDIASIPHSSSGLAPFYAFLCVIIFAILCWIPYKIFLKPVMPRI